MRRPAVRTALIAIGATLTVAFGPIGAARGDDVVGTDGFRVAPDLLFSDSASVASTVLYTTEGGEPTAGCGAASTIGRTAWWRFNGTGRPITLSTRGSDFDTVLAVYDAPSGTPIAGNRIACNDNETGIRTSVLTFSSVRGKNYLIQVGGNGPDHGKIGLAASSSARPANDDRVSAHTLETGNQVTVDNAGASQERGETLTCSTAPYAATMWFKWTAPAVGNAVFSATSASGETAVTIYRVSDGTVLGCSRGTLARVPLRVAPGSFLIQVGTSGANDALLPVGPITTKADFTVDPDVDNDGEPASTDCNDNDPFVRHGLVDIADDGIDQNCDDVDAVNLDRDGDGHNRPGDCVDGNAAIHPGAIDLPRNGVNEDCRGGDAPFPPVPSRISIAWSGSGVPVLIAVSRVLAGSRVDIRCRRSARCPFRHRSRRYRTGRRQIQLQRAFRGRRLAPRGVLEVSIVAPERLGRVRRERAGGRDKLKLCLDPRRLSDRLGRINRSLRPRAPRRGEDCE